MHRPFSAPILNTAVFAAAGGAQAAADLGDLPNWRLEDLYPAPTSKEYLDDLAKAEADSLAFETK